MDTQEVPIHLLRDSDIFPEPKRPHARGPALPKWPPTIPLTYFAPGTNLDQGWVGYKLLFRCIYIYWKLPGSGHLTTLHSSSHRGLLNQLSSQFTCIQRKYFGRKKSMRYFWPLFGQECGGGEGTGIEGKCRKIALILSDSYNKAKYTKSIYQ